MAFTKRGQLIYAYFKQHPTLHPTAEEVYEALKSKDIHIGVATVYRNLRTLVEQGYLKEINLEKQGVRYDLAEYEHHHFVCDRCGSIENFVLPTLQGIDQEVEHITGGKLLHKELLIHGICKSCQK